MHSTSYQKMIEALTPILKRYETPFILTHRNIPPFMSEEFENFLAKHGIQHRKYSPLSWPQAKGEVEGQNRTLLKSLKVAEAEGKKWREELDKFPLAYRITPHRSTETTPAILMFGKELKTKRSALILGDPGAASRVGRKGGTKVFKYG